MTIDQYSYPVEVGGSAGKGNITLNIRGLLKYSHNGEDQEKALISILIHEGDHLYVENILNRKGVKDHDTRVFIQEKHAYLLQLSLGVRNNIDFMYATNYDHGYPHAPIKGVRGRGSLNQESLTIFSEYEYQILCYIINNKKQVETGKIGPLLDLSDKGVAIRVEKIVSNIKTIDSINWAGVNIGKVNWIPSWRDPNAIHWRGR